MPYSYRNPLNTVDPIQTFTFYSFFVLMKDERRRMKLRFALDMILILFVTAAVRKALISSAA